MWVADVLRSQFGAPSGLFGSAIVAPLLNLTNRRLIDTTIELLGLERGHRVLDVGYGPGYSLQRLADTADRVAGIDFSEDMVAAARKLVAGRRNVRAEWGDVADLPFRSRAFDRAMTVNAIYYWPDLDAGLREIARVLKPGGRLAVGFRSPLNLLPFTLTWTNFRVYEAATVARAMESVGFRVLRVEHRDWWRIPDTVVVVGERFSLR